jgi:hypothetical protein
MMAGWEEAYQPDLGAATGIWKALQSVKPLGVELPVGLGTVGNAIAGTVANMGKSAETPPLEVLAGRGFPTDPAVKASAVLGGAPAAVPTTPIAEAMNIPTGSALETAVGSAQSTISPSVDPSRVDMGKFLPWYANAAKMLGLHEDWRHPDMNKNILDIFTQGGQPTVTAPGNPDTFTLPSGKTIPVTPEQLDQERNPALTTAPTPTAPAAPAAPTPTPQQSVAGYTQDMGREIAPPLPQTPASEMLGSQPAASGLVKPDTLPGKIMTVAGMIASAANPRQFGQAGEMLSKAGAGEVAKVTADAAAQRMGYADAAHLEAAKTAGGIAHTKSETALNTERVPFVQAEVNRLRALVPNVNAETALTQARRTALDLETTFKSQTPPVQIPFTDPLSGQTTMVTVTGDHAFAGLSQNVQNRTQFLSAMSAAGLHSAEADKIRQYVAQNNTVIPMTLIPGAPPVNMSKDQYLHILQITNQDWKTRNASQLHLYETSVKPINMLYQNSLGGRVVIPVNLKMAGANAAKQLMSDPNPLWRDMGENLALMVGEDVSRLRGASRVGAALATPSTGVSPISPSSPSWLGARPGGQ